MAENNDNSSDSLSRGEGVLQGSRLNNPIKAGVLRPSLFGSNLNSSGSVVAEEEKIRSAAEFTVNPFLKETKDEDAGAEKDEEEGKSTDEKIDPLSLLAKNGLPKSTLFDAAKNSIPLVESSGFVFGQNVHERVTGENIQGSSTSVGESSKSNTEKSENSTNDSSLLFTNALQSTVKPEADAGPAKEVEQKSLDEVAREYEESRAQKRKYEEVETFTGEENEVNIIDVSCKIFAFVNSNWEERGRGALRLNDSKDENECSRVVFRTSGNLRLLVNTKVWQGMIAERPSQKSLRFTAMDHNGQIKIFLVMSRPEDINSLHKALSARIEKEKKAIEVEDSEIKNGTPEKNEETSESGEPSPKISNN